MAAINRSIQFDDFSLALGILLPDFLVGLGSNEFLRFAISLSLYLSQGFSVSYNAALVQRMLSRAEVDDAKKVALFRWRSRSLHKKIDFNRGLKLPRVIFFYLALNTTQHDSFKKKSTETFFPTSYRYYHSTQNSVTHNALLYNTDLSSHHIYHQRLHQ